jgi:hypothetical protein
MIDVAFASNTLNGQRENNFQRLVYTQRVTALHRGSGISLAQSLNLSALSTAYCWFSIPTHQWVVSHSSL